MCVDRDTKKEELQELSGIKTKGGNRVYISEFTCGFVACILLEVAGVIVYAIYDNWKKKH
jgi:hypothetical protein